jgi:hypothetical protein
LHCFALVCIALHCYDLYCFALLCIAWHCLGFRGKEGGGHTHSCYMLGSK